MSFDTERGSGRIRWLRRTPQKTGGWALKRDGVWYAVWSNGADLIFQAGSQKIPLVPSYECRNQRSGRNRTFEVIADGRTVVQVTYDALDRDRDPTFDDADLEQEDFFVWVSRLWNDAKWRREVVKNWLPS